MSLIFLTLLIGIGLMLIFRIREHQDEWEINDISANTRLLLALYAIGLIIATIICFGYGVFTWLKHGTWITTSLDYLINQLDSGNSIKAFLTSDTSWVGLHSINLWYLKQNIGWSFIVTQTVLHVVYYFQSNNTIKSDTK